MRWGLSLLLYLPFLAPVVCHYLAPPPGMEPTGFIQPDLPYYMSNAREHFDEGFGIFYSLPFSPFAESPRIYFQPQSLLLGAIHFATGLDPGVLFLLFGLLSGVAFIRLALAVFETAFGLDSPSKWLTAITMVWGGGLLCLAGAVRAIVTGDLNDLFFYDPAYGLWFLNLGRNLIYPHESYYHAVFFAALLLVACGRWGWAVAAAAWLSASHPFTGLQLLCVLIAWAGLERLWIGNRELPRWWLPSLVGLLIVHLAAYRLLLPALSFEHRVIEDYWIRFVQDWTYEIEHFLPGYALVGIAAGWQLRSPGVAAATLSRPFARLALVIALVSFALANNEFAFRPNVQPLHFTRGYVWTGLFLLGAPAVIGLTDRLWQWRGLLGKAAVAAGCGLWWADNAVFLTAFHLLPNTAEHELYVPAGFHELTQFLSEPEQAGCLVLLPDDPTEPFNTVAYLLTTYTPLRVWHSHPYNTPFIKRRMAEIESLFSGNEFLDAWSLRPVLIVMPAGRLPPPVVLRRSRPIFSNFNAGGDGGGFTVYRVNL